jgi:hypothetical protein
MVLQADGAIEKLPQAQGLLEMILRSVPDLLEQAKDGDDFHELLMKQIEPFQAEFGPMSIKLTDRLGDPADLNYDEFVVVQVHCDQLMH